MRVLTWNLFHGRSVPNSGRDLQAEFAAAIAGWEWDVALLQEVPPWWPPALGEVAGAHARTALTSRNAFLPVRRFVAERWPDLIKSNGGGANAILVRRARVVEHRRVTLRRRPERRVCHAVRLVTGVWCANLHAQVHSEQRAQADIDRAAAATLAWAAGSPAILGGDFNVRRPTAAGFTALGGRGVDHVLGAGFSAPGTVTVPDRGELSDHPAVIVQVP